MQENKKELEFLEDEVPAKMCAMDDDANFGPVVN